MLYDDMPEIFKVEQDIMRSTVNKKSTALKNLKLHRSAPKKQS
jgi:hypothetical protein